MSNATEVAAMAADVEGQPEEGQPNAWIAAQTQPPPGGCRKFIDKGSVSNFITFTIMTTFICLKYVADIHDNLAVDYGLAFGLFGFAGGITNWLAVKMLFDTVSCGPVSLIGSGVIPHHFKEIRSSVKSMCLSMFFDEAKMKAYLGGKSDSIMEAVDLPKVIAGVMSGPDVDEKITTSLTALSAKPEGAMIEMIAPMMGGIPGLVAQLKPMLTAFAADMGSMMATNMDLAEMVPVAKIRAEVETFMDEGLLLLTPDLVKTMMENIIREHLGWLVVWGNVFGGLIGVICLASGLRLGQP